MPDTNHPSGIRVPLGSDAFAPPADLSRFRDDVGPMLVYRATDEADRDARYGSLGIGQLVEATSKEAIWRKTATGWRTVWSWVDWTQVALLNSFTSPEGVFWKRVGDQVFWRGRIRMPDDYTSGYLSFCAVPADARPSTSTANHTFAAASNTPTGMSIVYVGSGAYAYQLQAYAALPTAAYIPVAMTYLAV